MFAHVKSNSFSSNHQKCCEDVICYKVLLKSNCAIEFFLVYKITPWRQLNCCTKGWIYVSRWKEWASHIMGKQSTGSQRQLASSSHKVSEAQNKIPKASKKPENINNMEHFLICFQPTKQNQWKNNKWEYFSIQYFHLLVAKERGAVELPSKKRAKWIRRPKQTDMRTHSCQTGTPSL